MQLTLTHASHNEEGSVVGDGFKRQEMIGSSKQGLGHEYAQTSKHGGVIEARGEGACILGAAT